MKRRKKIYIGSDHGGLKLKVKLISFLQKKGYTIQDIGPHTLQSDDDYPDYAIPLGKMVVKNKSKGILICRNGQGISIAANKVKGVRAVTGFSSKMIQSTRLDDNANIVSLPADYITLRESKKIVLSFLSTSFLGEKRHKRRLRKIAKFEK